MAGSLALSIYGPYREIGERVSRRARHENRRYEDFVVFRGIARSVILPGRVVNPRRQHGR